MKKRFKKFMALVMTAALLCSSMTVFAKDETHSPASGSATGNAKLEGWVEKNVFCVNLPTEPIDSSVFSFRLDPQDLFRQSSGNSLGIDKSDVQGDLLYFTNHATGNAITLSGSSDTLTATNKGSVDVDVTLSATITNIGKIELASSTSELASADAASIYVAIESSGLNDATGNAITAPVAIVGSSASAEVKGKLDCAPTGAYEILYDATGNEYAYELTAAAKDPSYTGFHKVEFNLTGACNSADNVDWTKAKDAEPVVNVVWKLSEVGGTSASATPNIDSLTVSHTKGSETVVPVTLGSGETAAKGTAIKVTVATSQTGSYSAGTGVSYNASKGGIVFGTNAFSQAASGSHRYVKVVFDDTAKTTKTIDVTIN